MKFLKLISIALCGFSCCIINTIKNKNKYVEQVVRTVKYDDIIDEATLKEGFDYYDINYKESKVEVNALKFFDKNIFEGLDLVSALM